MQHFFITEEVTEYPKRPTWISASGLLWPTRNVNEAAEGENQFVEWPGGGGGGGKHPLNPEEGLRLARQSWKASCATFANTVVQLGIFSCTPGLKLA